MRDCLSGDARFGVVLIERGSEVGGGDQRAELGTRGVITRALELADGRWALVVQGEVVVRIEHWLADDPYPVAMVSEVEERPARNRSVPELDAAVRQVRHTRAMLAEHGGAAALSPDHELDGAGDPGLATWQLCAAAPVSAYDAQRLLVAGGVVERLSLLGSLMDELELDLLRMHGGS
jgi:Lon protease-like protein